MSIPSIQTATQDQLDLLYRMVSNGDMEAYKFIIAFQHYCHAIDDDVDGDNGMDRVENKVGNYFLAAALYTSNYWKANHSQLYTIVAIVSSDYIDSNSPNTIPQADFLRSTGNNILKAVAFIQGGWALLRQVSPIIHKLSYTEHHDLKTGKGI